MQALTRITLGLLAAAIILLALALWTLRLAMINIDSFKPEIEYLLTRDINPGISFGGIAGEMNRFNPVLRLENMSLTLPDHTQPVLIDRLVVEFDFWDSLRAWAPVAREISSTLEKLELRRDAEGRWWLDQLALAADGDGPTIRDLAGRLALAPRYLKVDLRRLVIHDQRRDAEHTLERVRAYVDHRSDQYLVQVSAALPPQLGRGILIKSVLSPGSSLLYVNASNLQTRPVADLFDIDTWGLRQGALDGELWFNLDGRRTRAINGDIVLKNGVLQMTPEKRAIPVSYQARFNAINRESGWRISNRFVRMSIDGKRVPGFRAQMRLARGDYGKRLLAWVERIALDDLATVLPQFVPADIGAHVKRGKFSGLIENFVMILDPARPRQVKLGGSVRNLESEGLEFLPGMRNLNARIRFGDDKLGVEIDGRRVSLDFGDFFRAPLEFDELRAEASLQFRRDGLLLEVRDARAGNADLDLESRLWLEAEAGQRPFMFLRANFSGRNAENHARYLPVAIMPEKTVAWLDRGIQGGRIPRGDLQFHGRLRSIKQLARTGAGDFFAEFEIADAEVLFAPGWQPARDASGRGLFHNTSMTIDLDRVSFDRIDDVRARAVIADFGAALVEVDARADATAAAALATWLATPVGEAFRQPLSGLDVVDGRMRATVALRAPLKAVDTLDSRVSLDLEGIAANAPDWGLELGDVGGRLVIAGREVRSQDLRGRFFGDPVELVVEPAVDTARTLIRASGRLDSRRLSWSLPQRLRDRIEGKSDWQLRFGIAGGADGANTPGLSINAASMLAGTALDFPEPFAKPANRATRISLDLDFYRGRIDLGARYGETIRARGRFARGTADAPRVESLDLAFARPLRANATPGLNVYGRIERASLEEWVDLYASADGADPGLLQSAELEIGDLKAYTRRLKMVRLEVEQTEAGFVGAIESDLLRGRFEAPTQKPIGLDIDYLHIDKLERDTDYSALLPQHLSDFELRCAALVYHDMLLNDVAIDARVVEDALLIDRLDLRRDQVKLTASGKWEYRESDGSHASSLVLKIAGKNLGEALSGLGFGDSIGGGEVELEGGFAWSAPALGFSLENLVGDANLKIRDGVLNNVEPGSGRFVGLLSLSALPRRLSLDFSDLLIKGMEFDKIEGTYHLERGRLHTNDTKLEGPSATIRISGTTGIVERNYDQVIRVTPSIRQTLPVIGAVTAGSSVGWGLLLLQNLFKKTIDKAVEVEYRISGSWDDPKIELIKAVDENQQEVPYTTNR